MTMIKTNEAGRSMIEMLGVLAIIGVLSVGGIAGYSKAMNKFKTNKVADNVSMLVANIKTLYAQQNTYTGLDNKSAISMGVVPDELGTNDNTGTLTNAFSGPVYIDASESTSSGDNKAFILVFQKLSREACISLVTNDWGSGYSSGLIAIEASGSDLSSKANLDTIHIGNAGSDTVATPGGTTNPVPMSVTKAASACSCKTGNLCSIAWKYY